MVGILLFVAKTVRLDIVQSVSMLSRFLKNPREIHMNVARRVLTFFYIIKARALACKNDDKNCFDIYVDAIYVDCLDGKSICGYIIKFVSALISWCSRKVPCIVTLFTDAEYVAASKTLKECVWLDEILKVLKINSAKHKPCIDNE